MSYSGTQSGYPVDKGGAGLRPYTGRNLKAIMQLAADIQDYSVLDLAGPPNVYLAPADVVIEYPPLLEFTDPGPPPVETPFPYQGLCLVFAAEDPTGRFVTNLTTPTTDALTFDGVDACNLLGTWELNLHFTVDGTNSAGFVSCFVIIQDNQGVCNPV